MPGLRALVVAAAVGAVVVGISTPAGAVASNPVAVWEMNEARGATVMVDSSGHGLNGTIGTEVTTGFTFAGATGYDFAWLLPNTPPPHPQHIVAVPDNTSLDPGTRDYAVTVRMRTTSSFGNVVQKGQSTVPGGNWKIEAPLGFIRCMFKGSSGGLLIKSDRTVKDGLWHTIRCERTATALTLTIDGVLSARGVGATGNISNTWPVSIGGKSYCNQTTITCDYFPGEIDRIQIDAG
jgi:hypothetical protein